MTAFDFLKWAFSDVTHGAWTVLAIAIICTSIEGIVKARLAA